MRTTVTLDEDIRKAVDALRRRHDLGTSAAVNELARRGLAASVEDAQQFRQRTSTLGRPRFPIENIGETLELLEEPSHR